MTLRVRLELICVLFIEGNVYFIQKTFLNLLTQKYNILEKKNVCPEAIIYEDTEFFLCYSNSSHLNVYDYYSSYLYL